MGSLTLIHNGGVPTTTRMDKAVGMSVAGVGGQLGVSRGTRHPRHQRPHPAVNKELAAPRRTAPPARGETEARRHAAASPRQCGTVTAALWGGRRSPGTPVSPINPKAPSSPLLTSALLSPAGVLEQGDEQEQRRSPTQQILGTPSDPLSVPAHRPWGKVTAPPCPFSHSSPACHSVGAPAWGPTAPSVLASLGGCSRDPPFCSPQNLLPISSQRSQPQIQLQRRDLNPIVLLLPACPSPAPPPHHPQAPSPCPQAPSLPAPTPHP